MRIQMTKETNKPSLFLAIALIVLTPTVGAKIIHSDSQRIDAPAATVIQTKQAHPELNIPSLTKEEKAYLVSSIMTRGDGSDRYLLNN